MITIFLEILVIFWRTFTGVFFGILSAMIPFIDTVNGLDMSIISKLLGIPAVVLSAIAFLTSLIKWIVKNG